MRRNEAEFLVNIPVEGEEQPLRGKFRVKVRLSYRDILNMDSRRRQLLGPAGGEADGLAALIASTLSKVQTHTLEAPSWWKEAGDGLEFEDINVILKVAAELNKVEVDYMEGLKKAAEEAKPTLQAEVEKK